MLSKIRVLIGDDDPVIVAGLQTTLKHYPNIEVVGQIDAPSRTLDLVDELKPDVIVMDLDWWGNKQAGVEQIRYIRKNRPVKVIAVTAYSELLENARQAGAHEARTKGFSGAELAKCIEAVSKTEEEVQSPHLVVGTLSRREVEVLRLVAEGLTDREIGRQLLITEPTAKSHVRSVFGKLNAKNRAEAVAVGFKTGIL